MGTRVLIVDDSPVIAEALDSILSSHGCRVETCFSGETGWKRLVAGSDGEAPIPDVVLLDLRMPGLDGMSLLTRIRADRGLASLPVIIVTADTNAETRREALGAGANDYLCKPLELSDLLMRVEEWSTRWQASV